MGEIINAYSAPVGKSDYAEDLGVDGKIIL
jgi:hypothetical protein